MNLYEFVNVYNGKRVGTGQCPALIKQYEPDVLGLPATSVGNAHQYYDNYYNTTFLYTNFERITYNGSNTPQAGDIVVFNTNVGGGYGHVDIAYSNITNSGYTGFDQNWNSPKKCSLDYHSYNNVLGWLRPRNAPAPISDDLLRSGIYGNYYGNQIGSSQALSESQMQLNATYIYGSLTSQDSWTLNAIAAMLGNMEAESTINPGRWQSNDVGNMSMGYGLVQWTPASKYINWVYENGYSDYSVMDLNIGRIRYEVANNIQWIATGSYPMSFNDFAHSNANPYDLAIAFLLNYERPADQSESVQAYRGALASKWYAFLSGVAPPTPEEKKKEGFNFILFNRRRRTRNG